MSKISNPILRALLEPEQKAEPVAVDPVDDYDEDDDLLELLADLADHEDEEEATPADELPDNLAPCDVFPVGGLPPLTPRDAYAMAINYFFLKNIYLYII